MNLRTVKGDLLFKMIKTSDTAAGDIVEISLPTGGPYGIVFAADTDGCDCIIVCLYASKSFSFFKFCRRCFSFFTRLMKYFLQFIQQMSVNIYLCIEFMYI